MNSLTLSPYKLKEEKVGVFSFITDDNIKFSLSFRLANDKDGFENNKAVQNKILVVNFRPNPKVEITKIKDKKISITICTHLKQALDNGYILNYICSDDGGYERHRRILFGTWYLGLDYKDDYEKSDYTLEDDDGKLTYLGFIVKRDNISYDEFSNTVDKVIEEYQFDK